MPPLTTRDWYIGCALQGLLSHPGNIKVDDDAISILSEDERREAIYSEVVEIAFEIGSACMTLRKELAGDN